MSETFNFGEGVTTSTEVTRAQLVNPLDVQSRGLIKDFVKEISPELNRVQSLTLRSGDTTFDVRGTDNMSLTGAAAVSISTITSGYNGQLLTLIFNDANVTLVHNATGARSTMNLGSGNLTGTTNSVIQLVNDGTSWKKLTDILDLSVWADVIGDYFDRGNAPLGNSSITSYGSVARVADAVASASGLFRVKAPKGATSISAIRIYFERNATGDVRLTFASAYYATTAGGTVGQDNTDAETTYTISGGLNVVDFITVPAGAYNGLTIAEDNTIELTFFRNSAAAADTLNTYWPVVGARFIFA